jgi:hypothetical protein
MPRYFFNVLDGKVFEDTEGTELPDTEAAEEEAVRTAGEIIRDDHFAGETWRLQVRDEEQKVILTLSFAADGRRLGHLGHKAN